MKDLNKNQAGFGIPGLLLSLAVVVLIGAAGWFVYQNNKTEGTTASEDHSQNTGDEPVTGEPEPTVGYLEIEEWGVELPLSDDIRDAYYVVGTGFPKNSDGQPSGLFLSLRSLTDDSCDPNSNNTGGSGAVGAILRVPSDYKDPVSPNMPYTEKYPNGVVIGDYYYTHQSWADTSKCTETETVQSSDSAFAAAAKEIRVSDSEPAN